MSHNKSISVAFLTGLLCILNVLFLVYWVVISMNYCLHYDDVHFMWKMREYSILEYVREMYMTRGGNFVAYGQNGVVFSVSNWIGDYHVWPLVFYVLGIVITYFAVKDSFIIIAPWKTLLGVMTLYNIYILTVPDYAVFTWLCAMGYFLYGPCMCLLLRILNKGKLSAWSWTGVSLLSLYLSGTNVTTTPMVWLLLLVNALWIWKTNEWRIYDTWKNPVIKRIVYVTIGMMVVYAIMFVAPGNFNRLETGNDMQHPSGLIQMGIAWAKCIVMFFYFMFFYLPYHLMAVGLGYVAGEKNSYTIPNKRKAVTLVVGAFLIYLSVAVIPLAYLSNGFAIQRNYTHITFFYMLMFFVLGSVWGSGQYKHVAKKVLCALSGMLLLVGMVVNLLIDLPIAKAYSSAHQERFDKLLQLQEDCNKETVVVDAYPSSLTKDTKYFICKMFGKSTSMQAIYYESDTKGEPNEYEYHVRKLLGLDFDFVLNNERNN